VTHPIRMVERSVFNLLVDRHGGNDIDDS